MNILNLSTYAYGGAGIAALRFHNMLLEHDIKSNFCCISMGDSSIKNIYELPGYKQGFFKKVFRKLGFTFSKIDIFRKIAPVYSCNYEIFSIPFSNYDIVNTEYYKSADLIIIHWVSNLLDYTSFFKNNTKPLIIYMHDLNHASGGFHYSGDLKNCNDHKILELDHKIHLIKKYSYRSSEILVLGNSRWTTNFAISANIFPNETKFATLHYCLDKNFRRLDKKYCKSVFNIDSSKITICFGAQSVLNNRKGFSKLLRALQYLKLNHIDFHLLVFGDVNTTLFEEFENLTFTGFISNSIFHSVVYSACDIFVMPSLEEAFGQTLLEAMSCGVCPIGFNIGGISDLIIHDENGLLANPDDEFDLFSKINHLIHNPKLLNTFGDRSLEIANNKFSSLNQYNNFKYLLLSHFKIEI
jgi:glycosyltransferase involved in cell wall biosynthesis